MYFGKIKNSGITEEAFNDINLVPGFLDKTLNKFPDCPIALLHLGVDPHDSYKDAPNALFPKVVNGGSAI